MNLLLRQWGLVNEPPSDQILCRRWFWEHYRCCSSSCRTLRSEHQSAQPIVFLLTLDGVLDLISRCKQCLEIVHQNIPGCLLYHAFASNSPVVGSFGGIGYR